MNLAPVLIVACLAATAARADDCITLEKAKTYVGPDAKIVHVSEAQYHFLQGFYIGTPTTEAGLPPGDGAIVFTKPPAAMPENDALILWTTFDMVCGHLAVRHELVEIMQTIRDGAGDGKGL